MAYVYRHIRLDTNQPFYIGVGFSCNDIKYKRAYSNKNRNIHWNRIVNKTEYEVEIILDNLTDEEAFNKEIEFIKLYGKNSDGGILCNISDGGNGGFLGKEVNEKRKRSLHGHSVSSETRQKIRAKAIGRKASVGTKIKMSEIHKKNNTGNWLESKGHKNGNAKKVYQYSIDGALIKEWECGVYACKELNISTSCLSAALNGKQKTSGGYIWKLNK